MLKNCVKILIIKIKLGFKATLVQDENKLFEILNTLDKESIIAFDTETTGLDTKEAKIVGFSFA